MEQPRGIKAFGWGLLGFFGANMLINFTTLVGGLAASEAGASPQSNGGHFIGFLLGMIFAGMFANSRDYSATSTGAWISFSLQAFVFIAGFIVGLSEIN